MAATITLKAIVDELEALSDEHFAYLNPQTGDLVTLSSEEISAVEEDLLLDDFPTWQQEVMAQARAVLESNEYLQLPTHYDLHEYAIVEAFCASLSDVQTRQIFLEQIRGSGAFRRFKQLLDRYGRTNEWYEFRTQALEEIAAQWLDAHQIPYQRDKGEQRRAP
jgi:hypothetical protein